MAFEKSGLHRFAAAALPPSAQPDGSGRQPGMWSYCTADAVATVETANYFNAVADWFVEGAGDVIFATMVANDGSNGRVLKAYTVKRTGGVVHIKSAVVG